MIDTQTLVQRLDAYKSASRTCEDTTVSHRVFGDTKKLSALRNGGDITVRRFNAAMAWLDQNWPSPSSNQEKSHDLPQSDASSDAA